MGKSRRYYRRKYRRIRWCPNITNIADQGGYLNLVANPGDFSNTATLISNPVQSNLTTSQIFTVKNVEVSFNIETVGGGALTYLNQLTVYIMFVPQGMNVSQFYHKDHPEYIMAMRYLGNPDNDSGNSSQSTGRNAVRVKSRLARKLNTGDTVILYISGLNTDDNTYNYGIYGVIRWWTKAN